MYVRVYIYTCSMYIIIVFSKVAIATETEQLNSCLHACMQFHGFMLWLKGLMDLLWENIHKAIALVWFCEV